MANIANIWYCTRHGQGAILLEEDEEPKWMSETVCGVENCQGSWELHGTINPDEGIISIPDQSTYDRYADGWRVEYFPQEVYTADGQHLTEIPQYILEAFQGL